MLVIGFLLSVVGLFAAVVLFPKSKVRLPLMPYLVVSCLLSLCMQVLTAGVLQLVHVGISLMSMMIVNLLCAVLCLIGVHKEGRQRYTVKALDVLSVLLIVAMTAVFGIWRYGKDLHIFSASVDDAMHARYARTVALEHRFSMNLYFTSLIEGLMMQVYMALTGKGAFDANAMYVLGEILFAGLGALIFWALLRVRSKEESGLFLLLPLLLTPLYWAGYPLYSTLFGFAYLGLVICLLALLLILLDGMMREKLSWGFGILSLNLVLYGVFVSYTLFVPTAFFGTFLALCVYMKKHTEKLVSLPNILTMLKVFLVPSVLGMLYSYVDLKAISPGGLISWSGGCYNDLYSNFILPLPLACIGIYFLVHKREGTYLFPVLSVQLLLTLGMLIGMIRGGVSIYYYSKNNSALWLFVWLLVAEGIYGMMAQTVKAILFPALFYGMLFMGKIGDKWIEEATPAQAVYRVESSAFNDLILLNSVYMMIPTEMDADTMALYRYVDENLREQELVQMNGILQSVWYTTLTGQENNLMLGGLEELQHEVEAGAEWICACYASDAYRECEAYLDGFALIYENSAGRILHVR
ncbi:MAG: hypothetical protein IJ229_08080 [Clostridia bacterium]|nr:hypothetical protein [Clostridia bacterium]